MMSGTTYRRVCCGAALLAALAGGLLSASADVVRLHAGGELRGRLLSSSQADPVTLETLAGVRIDVAAADVAFITQRPLALEEYEVRSRKVPTTAAAHWDLALWCRDAKLAEQFTEQCRMVVQIDPEHEAAHRALGHVERDGQWVDLDEYMTERGYVKHKGRWITQPELDLLQKTAAELEREQAWYPNIRLWTTWVTGKFADRQQKGLAALQEIRDDDAAPAVVRLMGQHAARDVRLLAVQILSQGSGPKSAMALANLTIADPDETVSDAALAGIPEQHYLSTQDLFIQKLRSPSNPEVNRAGAALRRVGNVDAVPQLIQALITTHRYRVRVRGTGAPAYSFGADGSFAGPVGLPPGIEAGLRTGQFPNGVILLNSPDPAQDAGTRIVTVRQEQQNPEVLATLRAMTGGDFGYDERTWQLWWSAQKHAGKS